MDKVGNINMSDEMIHNKLFLKTQRNKIFEAIREVGMNPSEFEWAEAGSVFVPNRKVPMLRHTSAQFHCVLATQDCEYFMLTYSPGATQKMQSDAVNSFEAMIVTLSRWASNLKREIEAPDLWAAAYEESKFTEAASATEASNEAFSVEEQKYISAQLYELEEYIRKTHNLTDEQLEFVKRRISYLEEDRKRQGRQDWIHTTIGVLFTIAFSLGLPGEAVRELFRVAATLLGKIVGTVLSLPIP